MTSKAFPAESKLPDLGLDSSPFKDTDIGPIPIEWEVSPLGKLCQLRRDAVDPQELPDVPYVGLEHIDSGDSHVHTWSSSKEVKSSKNRFVPGDVLYSKLRPYLDKAVLAEFEGICTTELLVLKTTPALTIPEFLIHILHTRQYLTHAISVTSGTNLPRARWTSLKDYRVPLPPLPEQRRIAHVLSAIQRAIAAQEDVIAAAKETKRSLMQRLFTYGPGAEPAPTKETEVGEIPAHWDLSSLGSLLAAKLRNGIYKPRASYGKGQIRVIQLNDIYVPDARIQPHLLDTVRVSDVEAETYRVLGGDLIINRVSKREEGVGAVALVESSDLSTIFESNMFRVRLDRSRISPEFFLQYGQSDMYRRQVMFRATKANQTSINQGSLQSVPVPIPKLSSQLATAETLNAADRKIAAEERRKAALQALFQSMLQQLMTGRVRVTSREGGE